MGRRGANYVAPAGDGFAALRCRLRLCRSDVSRDRGTRRGARADVVHRSGALSPG
ncbi:hypothetical protein LA76x_4678 [Lysobacter antibioticus]|uniref:Uncharacterized protein n=1 Tax=Lysobacter antibioticus TaxID=84531 RepID=A0A0S2FGX0_LYSAN|nr:hypothetical protein LA76x_4678 [Lysobacter antibioticus]